MIRSRDGQTVYFIAQGGFAVFTVPINQAVVTANGFTPTRFAGGTDRGAETDGGPALANVLFILAALAEDKAGNIYILDSGNQNVRKVDISTRKISTVVQYAGLNFGRGLAVDSLGNIIVSVGNQVLAFNPKGELAGVVGAAQPGSTADGVDGQAARLNNPCGLSIGPDDRVYVADSGNGLVRSLTTVKVSALEVQSSSVPASGPIPAKVLVRGSDGAPLGSVRVQFTISPSSAILSAASVLSDNDGTATVLVSLTGVAPVEIEVSPTRSGAASAFRPSVAAAISLGDFGAAKTIAPGGWMEIYGTNLSPVTQVWSGTDFVNGVAPTSLSGVTVLINGIPAFINRISPTQISAVAPDDIGVGNASVRVINTSGTSEAFRVTAADRAPALLAPLSFKRGDRQYVFALLPDGNYAGPSDLITGAPFRPAARGERLLLYGIGFGSTQPNIPSGKIADLAAVLFNVRITIGDSPASVEYAGLAVGFVGLYQFNTVVRSNISGDFRILATADGVPLSQELWITIK